MGSYYMLSRHTLQKVIPIVLTIAFVLLLSIYNYKLYVNNYYTLFDLGVGYRLSYLFSQTFSLVGWPFPHRLVSAIPYTKMFYTVTGITLLAYDSPLTLLIDQTVVIGLGSYALYKIAEIKTGSYKIGVTFQVLYFLFPSTYGFMGQGGNFCRLTSEETVREALTNAYQMGPSATYREKAIERTWQDMIDEFSDYVSTLL